MPTGEIAPQQAHLVSGNEMKTDSNTPPSMSLVNPAASDKTNNDVIEVFDKLIWKSWEAGKEYIKNLVLKNLSVKTLKLTYRVPESRFFSTIYPKPIFLSEGSSFTLPVTFRPLEDILYRYKIVFTLKLTHTPVVVDTTSIDYFSVVSVGDISRSNFKWVGTSIGPKVEVGSYSLNFKQIDLGCSGTKTLDIINNSDVEAVYQVNTSRVDSQQVVSASE